MNELEAMKKMMKLKGYNLQIISENCGFKHRSNASEMFRRKTSMRVDNLIRLLTAMDCELVIRSRTVIPRNDESCRMYRPEFVVELSGDRNEE